VYFAAFHLAVDSGLWHKTRGVSTLSELADAARAIESIPEHFSSTGADLHSSDGLGMLLFSLRFSALKDRALAAHACAIQTRSSIAPS
jgi:hypothetical protein